ncbi:MAG: hypothetical protein HEQ40_13280 [Lacibacter sp.]|jgi:hypothetical protein
MTEQEKFEKLFFEYQKAAMAFMDANDKMESESSKSEKSISDAEYDIIKKEFETASREYHKFLGYN